jgi:hypothetical protein
MLERSSVGAQPVDRHPLRCEALLAEQLAHELDGRRLVSTALNQDLEAAKPMGTRSAASTRPAVRNRQHGARRALSVSKATAAREPKSRRLA